MPSLRHLGGKMAALVSSTRRQDKHHDEPPKARSANIVPTRLILDIPDHGAVFPTMTSFPQFARLPLELRELIWSFGVSTRVVPVSVVREWNNLPYGAPPQERSCVEPEDWIVKCYVPPPVTLFVCQESRAVAKVQYTKGFSLYSPIPKHTAWVDVDRDILDLGDELQMFRLGDILRNIRAVRLYKSDELDFRRSVGSMKFMSQHFSMIYGNVREIQVVCLNGVEAWTGVDRTGPGPDRLERVWLIDKDTGEKTSYDLSWMQQPLTE